MTNNIFVVGAQRCGTTFLYHLLQHHPRIQMSTPVRPEPKFFLRQENVMASQSQYIQKLFSNIPQDILFVGEKTTSYIDHPTSLTAINATFPDAKIVLVLRDPVLRAWSNYKFSVENGFEDLSFEDAILHEHRRLLTPNNYTHPSVHPNAYLQRSNYLPYIDRLTSIFEVSQIKILIFEELLCSNFAKQEVFKWLGLDPLDLSVVHIGRVNSSSGALMPNAAVAQQLFHLLRPSIHKLELILDKDLSIWYSQPWYR